MSHAFRRGGPGVIQGNFHGSLPSFALSPAPHVQAAVQRQAAAQARTARQGNAFQVPSTLQLSSPGPGQPMPADVRERMESVFRADFSSVRIHVGQQAPAIGALAFTMSSDIFFAPGQYDPRSPAGQRLLGHELTHVVQQRAGRVRNPFGTGVAVVQDAGLEAEAERMGLRVAMQPAGRPVQARMLQSSRQPSPPPPVVSAHVVQPARGGPVVDNLRQPHKKWSQSHSSARRGGVRKAKWLRELEAVQAKRQARIDAVRRFMTQRVAPWATQARIAELIDENFREMKGDLSIPGGDTFLRPHELRNPAARDPQIAPGEVSFLAPSRSPGREAGTSSVIHRGIVRIEMVEEVPCVRVYSALWAEARPNQEGRIVFKDIHQDPQSREITIHTGRDQGEAGDEGEEEGNPIMWVSAEPLRQLKWFYKYPIEKYNPGARPVIRSFLVPLEVWNEISSQAVNEEVARNHQDRPFNVDTAYGSNQFGVRGPSLELLRRFAAPGSLISYVRKRSHSRQDLGGRIESIRSLHGELGAPTTKAPVPIWVDEAQGKFVRTKKQEGLADMLSFYHGVWTGNDHFIPDNLRRTPKVRRHQMLREFLTEQGFDLPDDYPLP